MFFLLRVAFWLGLVLVLLPTDKSADSANLPKVGAAEAATAAGAAVSDITQFCARQPAACEVGGQAATVIGHRAQAGARKIYQMITEKRDHTGSIASADLAALAADRAPADTLTSDDREFEWRKPSPPARPATDRQG